MTSFAALALGFAAGLRAMTPLAALTIARRASVGAALPAAVSWLMAPAGRQVVRALTLGEPVAAERPAIPDRPTVAALAVRAASGALAAAAVARRPTPALLLLGAAGAVAGACAGALARRRLARARGLPDQPVALLEDAVAGVLVAVALRSGRVDSAPPVSHD